MKKILKKWFILAALFSVCLGCKRDSDYISGTPSQFISNFDLRKLYRGEDLKLTVENMRGASQVTGQVVSDHSGNNLPEGLLLIQNKRIVGNAIDSIRGIAVYIGAAAKNYVPGDSVHVKIEGGILKRVDGILEITGKAATDVIKVASGRPLMIRRAFANLILSQPELYESTFVNLWKGTFNPSLAPTEKFAGDKTLNDGTADVILHTEANATFANLLPPYMADYRGTVLTVIENGKLVPQYRLRTANDIFTLSATADVPEVIITGFISDPEGSDTNAEYIQCRATTNINFATTKFTIVTTNNATASAPAGAPIDGWATGQVRTYKLELTSGTVSKGEIFYVGASNKLINGPSSTSIASAKWIRSAAYNTASPFFNSTNTTRGNSTTNLLANSGNAFGMAVFRGISIDKNTVPIDVVFVHNGGSLYDAKNGLGYRIGNTDVYDVIDHNSNNPTPFFLSGSNTQRFAYQPNAGAADGSGQGYFFALGGAFNLTLGKWTKARNNVHIKLTKTSIIDEIQTTNATEMIGL
ncbi:hypothetical protein SAMN04487898_102108 [Pedobacter sp. ok626]|uniref:DUF5689 domain-containing protein n=1 Tax=Pedobacter sp. ok626 TaxID=1761882 RepID=UPI00089257C8|nr:DUF5689 domain-containing protein [Pedobacter sp. ok626]SDJ26120.1 hypothetical protein SAMN04487898_102108 [Pedobacter sp. ok626]